MLKNREKLFYTHIKRLNYDPLHKVTRSIVVLELVPDTTRHSKLRQYLPYFRATSEFLASPLPLIIQEGKEHFLNGQTIEKRKEFTEYYQRKLHESVLPRAYHYGISFWQMTADQSADRMLTRTQITF